MSAHLREAWRKLGVEVQAGSPLDYPHPITYRLVIRGESAASTHPYFKDLEPDIVAFADIQDRGDEMYLAYVAVRDDQKGQGHARTLIQFMYDNWPDKGIDWGKMMTQSIVHLNRDFKERYPDRGNWGKVYAKVAGQTPSWLKVNYEVEVYDGSAVVWARQADAQPDPMQGDVPYIGELDALYEESGGDSWWFIELVEVDSDHKQMGIGRGMLLALHEAFPNDMMVHGNFVSTEGEAFADRMVSQYPAWNRMGESAKSIDLRDKWARWLVHASMGTPSVGFPEGFVFTPPLYRSMLSPGQRVIVKHPEMGGAEVGGIITGEIPTTGIMVLRLDGMEPPNVVHVPLEFVRAE